MAAITGLIRVMEKAARKAGQRLRRDFGEIEHLQVSRKGPSDFVSKADQAAERTLWDELRVARPDWGFLLEEAGEIEGDPTKPRWVIDPLDGTSNFLHGIPHFAISIAVQEPKLDGSGWGEVTAGLVYQPITDESFWAEKSRGAWLQDARLRVSGRRHLDESLIATGIPFQGHGDFGEWTRIFAGIGPQVAGIRRFGAASLDLAWVAAGRFEGYWESGLKPWDSAAGCLLVREAGGFVTDFRGRSQPICDVEVLAGNDALHSRLHKIVVGALKAG
jgi:myo-inositol-1(or 4)-monophosphatase